ncbi:MAG TPA: serine/threonine-protein kinase [Holophagaceae bacterium]|nr:serine/threonine-protein kinase [Holophagaceae bacterium]
MFSKDLERRVVSLALQRGLAKALPTASEDAPTPTLPMPDGSPRWGPRLDRWVEDGTLSVERLDALAWEAVNSLLDPTPLVPRRTQPDPAGDEPDWEPESVEALLAADGKRFSKLSLLGQGATARVFKAWDHHLERWVALKVLTDVQAASRDRILREARAQARVDHPNLCKVYEVGLQGSLGFIVLPWVEGESLTRWLATMDIPQKLELVRDIADGLQAAHEAGLVHMDLKPGNVLVQPCQDGRLIPLVSDFGMAAGPGTQEDWLPLGTPPFSSPEQLRGEKPDPRTDIYALGVILYVLCVGQLPFDGTTFRELLRQIHEEPPVPPTVRMPALSPEIEAIILRCMEKKPALRYPTARHLGQALRGFLDSKHPVLEALEAEKVAPAPASPLLDHPRPPPRVPEVRSPETGFWTPARLALGLLVVACLTAFALGHVWVGLGLAVILGTLAAVLFLILPRREERLSDRAARWMDLAQAGVPEAAFDLAVAYLGGREHLPQDDSAARYWLMQAAVHRHAEAMVLLADLFIEGRGGIRDLRQAETWLRRAFEAGHPGAEARLQRLLAGSRS